MSSFFLLLFFTKFRGYFYSSAYKKGGGTSKDNKPKEIDKPLGTVASENVEFHKNLMYPTRKHTRHHHTQGHKCRAEGIMGGLAFTSTEIYEIQHIS